MKKYSTHILIPKCRLIRDKSFFKDNTNSFAIVKNVFKESKDGSLPHAWVVRRKKLKKNQKIGNIYSRMEDFGLIEIDEDEIEKTRGTCPRCLRPVKVCLCEYIGIFINYNAYYINRPFNSYYTGVR